MNKMNKKGFTLIEMLVVIAIIAILVAIIIPTVLQSSAKAKAGTDAANLRSVIAEAYINVMSDHTFVAPEGTAVKELFSLEAAAKTEGVTGHYSDVKCKTDPNATLKVVIDSNNNVDAYFVTKSGEQLTLEEFAAKAGTGNVTKD